MREVEHLVEGGPEALTVSGEHEELLVESVGAREDVALHDCGDEAGQRRLPPSLALVVHEEATVARDAHHFLDGLQA